MADDVHEIYAVRYAHHDRQSPENYLFGDPHDVLQPLAYFVWAIVGPHGTFVVDTGFDESMARKRGRHIVKPIADGLKSIGIQADAVEDVIITHLHYDHCGNHDLFPRARYHLQDMEIAYSTGRYMCHPLMRIPFEADDVVAMVRKVFAGRVVFHDGAEQVAPGITLHRLGSLEGLQCVREDPARLRGACGVTTHLYSHMNEGRVFPVTFSGDVSRIHDDREARRLRRSKSSRDTIWGARPVSRGGAGLGSSWSLMPIRKSSGAVGLVRRARAGQAGRSGDRGCGRAPDGCPADAAPEARLNGDINPHLFANCSTCHRPVDPRADASDPICLRGRWPPRAGDAHAR
jgi:hypothetical protein